MCLTCCSLFSLLHPLTPRGKIAYLGLEGLKASSALIEEATKHEENVILRDEIFRVALNDDHVSALKQAKLALPDQTQWLEANELEWATPTLLGALRIHSGGCKVVHMPTYLKGLWSVCKTKGTNQAEWIVESSCTTEDFDWKERLASFDTVVLCAGSGLFQNSIVKNELPMQVVRGQSIELSLGERTFENALLCGKYATPLPESNRVLIGATQEFKGEPLDADEVASELKKKTNSFASHLWEDSNVDKITTGFRVQSNRGKNGRMPILGRLETPIHDDAWIFTGLSSRGLLYHGIFGDVLSNMILNIDGENEMVDPQDLQWWKKQKMKQK